MTDKSGVSPQAVSLPAGGGDIRGLGETFQPDLNSGTGNYRVPLDLLPGVRGIQPILALVYSTGAGMGPLGLGWSLPVPSICRRTFRGVPSYIDGLDAFIFGGSSELVEVSSGTFRVSVENGFQRFVRRGSGWEMTEKSGIRHIFGETPGGRIEFEEDGEVRVFAWLIERTEDTIGNTITYHYLSDGPQRYLSEVRYAIYTLRLEYDPRPDPFFDCRGGFELPTALRLSSIGLHVHPLGVDAVRTWRLEYSPSPLSGLSMLSRVILSGLDPETGATASLPPLEFSYAGFDPGRRRYRKFLSEVGSPPPGLDRPNLELIDLDGRGLPGVLQIENGAARYWPNRGGLSWGAPRRLPRFPAAISLSEDRIRFADMDGNGGADLLVGSGPLSGYYENNGRGMWEGFNRYLQSPGFAFEEDDLSLLDVNGDGLVDALRSSSLGLIVYENRGPGGWEEPRLIPRGDPATAPPDITLRNPRIRMADMNGDGLLDVVLIASGQVEYWASRGGGRYSGGRVMASSPRFPYPFDPSRVHLTDINGDGLADVLYVGYDEVTYWINRSGRSFGPPRVIRYTPPTPAPETLRVADMEGTGSAGLLWTAPYTDYRYLDFAGGVKPGLLERIDNHLGRVITISYGTSSEQAMADEEEGRAWSSYLPFPCQVVSSITLTDEISGLQSTTLYRYHEGHYDGHRREFDGFGWSEQIEVGDASMPTAVTAYYFHTEASARALVPDPDLRRVLKRKLYRVEVYGRDGSPLETRPYRVEESRWDVRVEEVGIDGRRVLFPFVSETVTSTSERGTEARIEGRIFSFDQYGNVLLEERRGEGGPGPDLFMAIEVDYAHNPQSWVVDRPARIVQRDLSGVILSETRHYYDGPAFQGLPLGQVTAGLLCRTELVAMGVDEASSLYGPGTIDPAALGYHPGQDADGRQTWNLDQERREMDARGNVVGAEDGRGNRTGYGFDAFGIFATSVTDARGFTATVQHDYRVGKPRRMTNPNGGVTEARYEPLGRISRVAFPGDSIDLPTAAYSYDVATLPSARTAEYRVISGQPRVIRAEEYLDGGGSVFQRRTEHDGNTFSVSGQIILNSRGKAMEKLQPFFAQGGDYEPYAHASGSPRQRFFYDPLGRLTETLNQDGGMSRASYEAWRSLFYDPGDSDPAETLSFDTPRVEHYDAWYRLVAVEEREAGSAHTTSYTLDPQGRLLQITDARGSVLAGLGHDLIGRRVAIDHLDAGRRLMAYDASGNMVLAVDAAGQRIDRSYDDLNRNTEVRYGTTAERLFYDSGPGENLIGKLARAVDPSGETTLSYDERGNVVERRKTVPGSPLPFVFSYGYDRLGRITNLTYPDGISVDYEYHSGTLLLRVPGYVEGIEYSAAGVRSAVVYANGVRTDYSYDAASLRLSGIRTHLPSSGDVYCSTGYSIDRAGNMDAVSDLAPGIGPDRTQRFEYDALYRLVRAEGFDALGAYSHDYAYDDVGNTTRNPLVSPHPLVYFGGGSTNRLRGFDDGTGVVSLFDYDANGNATVMPGRTLTFNPRQQLEGARLSDGADVHLFYDYRGRLSRKELSRPSGGSTTHYFDNLYEVKDGASTRWVYAGDLLVGVDGSGARNFVHNDHLGSAVIYTDASGNRLTESAYYPFGALAVPPAASALPSFTAKRLDEDIGLYYFHARWYAPDIGRFITPDPLYLYQPERGVQEPRRLNPYAYAGNNPVRFVDPSGLDFGDVLLGIGIAIAATIAIPVAVAIVGGGIAAVVGSLGLALTVGLGAGLAGAGVGAIIGGAFHGTFEGALRGAMIGFTAGVNFAVGTMFFGPLIGTALGVITFLSIIPPVAQSDVFQGFLGWSSYLMPMSWPGHALGLSLFTINIIGNLATFGQIDFFRVRDFQIDLKTGNIYSVGGFSGNLAPRAFNLGGFSFVNANNPDVFSGSRINPATFEHESGHMLNNAAFGFFHTIPAIITAPVETQDGYWERMTESNVPRGLRCPGAPFPCEADRPRNNQWGG